MGIIEDKIKDLKEREARILKMGGDKADFQTERKGEIDRPRKIESLF